jgi:putative ABC transport system permease protein
VSQIPVIATSPGALDAAQPYFVHGLGYDSFHDAHNQSVAVIGPAAAARLGITTLRTQPAIFIGETVFTVAGTFDDVKRKPNLLLSIVIPRTPAERTWEPPQDERAKKLVSTRLGAAAQVAKQPALALRPDHPEYLRAVPPPNPKALRYAVGGDLEQLFLLLSIVCLFTGAAGIANNHPDRRHGADRRDRAPARPWSSRQAHHLAVPDRIGRALHARRNRRNTNRHCSRLWRLVP